MGTWGDKRVRDLSPLVPSGQGLFIMLMIGPQTTNMPGVQPVGRLGFAEMLDWEPEAFDKAFAEVFGQGLVKADWKARLVFVPKAIQHNLPQSPNVVKSWASTWARVPDCDLKREAWETLYAALQELGESFAEAFEAACPLDSDGSGVPGKNSGKSSRKASGKTSSKASNKTTDNQEQEQEQKKEQEKEEKTGHASAPSNPVDGQADGLDGAQGVDGHDGGNPPAGPAPADPPAGSPESPPAGGQDDSLPRALGVRELVAEGVERKHALDWLKVRTAKKAPLTQSAWDDVKAEAKKAGITLAEAVKVSATNSWQGFRATWYARLGQQSGPAAGARASTHSGYDQRDYGTGGRL